jgi:hypothetical protein
MPRVIDGCRHSLVWWLPQQKELPSIVSDPGNSGDPGEGEVIKQAEKKHRLVDSGKRQRSSL